MRVTVPFNVGMTFAVIGYLLLLLPGMPADDPPSIAEAAFPDSDAMQVVLMLNSGLLAMVAGMFILRALWNRLFPHLCGWKPINLAESYALSLVLTVMIFGSS